MSNQMNQLELGCHLMLIGQTLVDCYKKAPTLVFTQQDVEQSLHLESQRRDYVIRMNEAAEGAISAERANEMAMIAYHNSVK